MIEISSFKNNVCIVEIENSSFCNRRCSYCINYYVDRMSSNEIMPKKLFRKIMDELSDIGYDKMVTFHRYNEPFFNKNTMILERISYARHKLPFANLVTSSNSDYLDADYVQKIKKAGLNSLFCQSQTEEYSEKSIEDIKEEIRMINKRIGDFKGKFLIDSNSCVYTTIGSGFKSLTIQAKNFTDTGFNRGDIVKSATRKGISGICFQPLISFTIDFNGKVTMCSNTVSYYDSHEKYIIGDCKKNTISEIYASEKAIALRNELLSAKRSSVCKNCSCNYEKYARQHFNEPRADKRA